MDETIVKNLEEKMNKSVEAYKRELNTVSIGRPNISIFEDVMVDYYGEKTPLTQTAQVSIVSANMIIITPFDRGTIKEVIAGIVNSKLDFNPQDEGDKIRINIAPLSAERRQDIAKSLSVNEENEKVRLRKFRQDSMKEIKNDKDASEDFTKHIEKLIQELTDKIVKQIEDLTKDKQQQLQQM